MNTDDLVTYLSALEPNFETHQFCWSGDHPSGKRLQEYGTLEDMLPKLVERNAEGFGIFVTVNAIDTPAYEDGYPRRRSSDVSRVRAVFADWDTPDRHIPETLLQPSMYVETSPGKYHIYWLVDDLPLLKFQQVQRGIASWMGSDPSVVDLSRVLRVPGFLHTKDLMNRTEVSLAAFDGARYSAEQVIEAFPATERAPKFTTWDGMVPPRARLTHAVVDALYGPPRPDGAYNVPCAWGVQHTTKDSLTSTIYYPPGEENGGLGFYKCLHAHCQERYAQDYDKWVAEHITDAFPAR
jgi:hypothetical protein